MAPNHLPQPAQAQVGARLDRAQRQAKPGGDLGVRQLPEVGVLDDLALVRRQRTQRPRDDLASLADVLQRYCDGSHHGGVALLERVFHADARLMGKVNGQHYREHRPVNMTRYVDYLALQTIGGMWGVVHKLFSAEWPRRAAPAEAGPK